MRPLDLTLRGFRSYAEESTFHWEGRGLVGIVGPTGSGKSSILDAVSFALYGKTPRIERDTKSLINQRRDAMHVALTFEIDGKHYKAVRSLRRGGSSAHAFYRVDDGVDVELADKSREMTEQVEVLLGLDFDAFRRSVLLAQNQFSRFLEATGTERNQVLKGVFDFGRLDAMRAIAKDRLDALGSRLAVLADRRATADIDRAALVSKTAELSAAEQRAAALELLREPFEEVKERIAAAGARAEQEKNRLDRLEGLARRIPSQAETAELFIAAETAESNVGVARQALIVATGEREAASSVVSDVLLQVGGKPGLTTAGDAVANWKAARDRMVEAERATIEANQRVEQERERATGISTRLETTDKMATTAAEEETLAVAALETARAAVEAAQQGHRAHVLRGDLVPGEPCPVCEQRVVIVPEAPAPAPVDDAARMGDLARGTLETAAAAARSASEGLARVRAEADATERMVTEVVAAAEATTRHTDEAAAELEAAGRVVEERLGPGDPVVALSAIRSDAAKAEASLETAVLAEEAARRMLDEVQATATDTAAALGTLRTDLATLAGLLESEIEVGDDPVILGQVFDRLRTQWIEERKAAEDAGTAAKEEAAVGRKALADLLEAAGLSDNDDVVEVIAAALAERTAKEAEVHLIEKRLEGLEQLDGDEAELISTSDLLRTVHGDLSPSKFLEFVLDERRRALGALGSEHLEILTAGRYRFDDSGDFLIVDLTAADAIRSPDSLSGGEMFLASLALALSLAEIVAREGGRLDAFFLDEGFGSLDPEHLDLAMDGIERLITTGPQRLVVVVSHVPALRERIEDLVVLDRDPITGDSIIVSGASPP